MQAIVGRVAVAGGWAAPERIETQRPGAAEPQPKGILKRRDAETQRDGGLGCGGASSDLTRIIVAPAALRAKPLARKAPATTSTSSAASAATSRRIVGCRRIRPAGSLRETSHSVRVHTQAPCKICAERDDSKG